MADWQFTETRKSLYGQSYIVTIKNDPNNISQVLLENFGNPGTQVVKAVGNVTANQIVISSQNMSNGWTVIGVGQMSNAAQTSMTWTYSITAGGSEDNYVATAKKQ